MKEMIMRTARTFFEAAIGYICANIAVYLAGDNSDTSVAKTALMGLLMSSVAAGVAAVLNMPKKK